jgi:hypothetical protein
MSQNDDIETVKRAADAQLRPPGEKISMEASWPPGRRPAPAEDRSADQECPNDNHSIGCRCHVGAPILVDIPPAVGKSARQEITDARPEREKLLEEARRAIGGDRQRDYGPPTPSFERIASMWAAILGVEVSAEQYAMCMVAVKLGRLVETPNHRDSWMDIAGYAALGSEVAATEGRFV